MARLYPPFLGAAIRVQYISADYLKMRVEMPLTWYNRNYVATQFGGSIYAMTDPFYMLLLIQKLGSQYVVWDKAAAIDFVKPGKGRLRADFRFSALEIEQVRERTASGDKYLFDKEVLVQDLQGEIIARVIKTLYVRKKTVGGK